MTLSRRTFVAAGGGLLGVGLVGCSSSSLPLPFISDPDDEVRESVAASEAELIAAYDAAIEKLPAESGRLSAIREQHAEHLAAMELQDSPAAAPAIELSGNPTTVLATLRKLETKAARARVKSCAKCDDGDLAALIAQIGTSEAAHAQWLW